jgi:hypothetical protein
MYLLESDLFQSTVHISDYLQESVMFPYTFLMYRGESVLFLSALHISDVPPGMCSVCVHSTHFWRTVWKCRVHIWICRLESFMLLCTVNISDVPSGKWPIRSIRLTSVVTVCYDLLSSAFSHLHKACFAVSSPVCDLMSIFIVTDYTTALYKCLKLAVCSCRPVKNKCHHLA